MKNQVKNLLRAGVLSLAAVFAFAFTQPTSNQPLYQIVNGQVQDVSGSNYQCNNPLSEVCTFEDPQLTKPAQMGRFQLIP